MLPYIYDAILSVIYVVNVFSNYLEHPKSDIFTIPAESTKILAPFKSLCIIFFECK